MSPLAADPASWDTPSTWMLDPAVFRDNLAALRETDPNLADALHDVQLPSAWRPAQALDGALTWRMESPGAAPAWLCGTALPRVRAEALLRTTPPTDRNPALASIGTGAELDYLLRHTGSHQCVFVFQADLTVLAAVLRLRALDAALRAVRCAFVPTFAEYDGLLDRLERCPGLQPPGTLLALRHDPPERVQLLRGICQRAAEEITRRRRERMQRLERDRVGTPGAPGRASSDDAASQPIRLAVVALQADAAAHQAARWLGEAARELGWPVCVRVADGPANQHPLPHAERLRDFAPTVCICINHDAERLHVTHAVLACTWHTHASCVPLEPSKTALHLAATSDVATLLRSRGVPNDRLQVLAWAFPAHLAGPSSPRAASRAVVVIGEPRDTAAAACGIEQPTHEQLWQAVRSAIEQAWRRDEAPLPEALLRQAERACDVALRDTELREHFLLLIQRVAIPGVIHDLMVQAVQDSGLELWTLDADGLRRGRAAARTTAAWGVLRETAAELVPACALVVESEPLTPALAYAPGLGWPLLMYDGAGPRARAEGEDVLQPGRDYERFTGLRDLHRRLVALHERPDLLRGAAERTAARVRSAHTYSHRLLALSKWLAPGAKGPRCAG